MGLRTTCFKILNPIVVIEGIIFLIEEKRDSKPCSCPRWLHVL
jgi:hypothetical protein